MRTTSSPITPDAWSWATSVVSSRNPEGGGTWAATVASSSREGREALRKRAPVEKTGLDPEHIGDSGSTKSWPGCGVPNQPSVPHYRCENPECGLTFRRHAAGEIDVLQKALCGETYPIGPDVTALVTYPRAAGRLAPDQRKAHRKVACRKAKALSSPPFGALVVETPPSKPTPMPASIR